MAGNCANGHHLFGLRGFLTITVIAFAITIACLVDETESARETKGSKSMKSNKEKVRRIIHASVKCILN